MRVQATPKKPLAGLPSDASTESQVSMVLFLTDFALPVTIGTHASYRDIVRRSGLADFSASKVEIEQAALSHEMFGKLSNGAMPKKIVVVPGRFRRRSSSVNSRSISTTKGAAATSWPR